MKPRHGDRAAAIGIIMLDTVFPRIPGDVGSPDTFDFPVVHEVVRGASPRRVVLESDPRLLAPFVAAARRLEAQGVRAITTSCGFLAIFHRELVAAVGVPVFTSSLLQVHLAQALLRPGQKVGILTARKPSLTVGHLAGVGIQNYPLAIEGMEAAEEFSSVFIGGKSTLDADLCREEVASAARRLQAAHPEIGAIVLECTNMPPYRHAVQAATGLPVFDAVTLVHHAHAVVTGQAFG